MHGCHVHAGGDAGDGIDYAVKYGVMQDKSYNMTAVGVQYRNGTQYAHLHGGRCICWVHGACLPSC